MAVFHGLGKVHLSCKEFKRLSSITKIMHQCELNFKVISSSDCFGLGVILSLVAVSKCYFFGSFLGLHM